MLTEEECSYLRELAKKQLEYSQLPVMAERTRRWYAHNDFEPGYGPMVVMELQSFEKELMPQQRITDPVGRELEYQLLYNITNHELIDDDKVVPDYLGLAPVIHNSEYGIPVHFNHAEDEKGRSIGFNWEYIIEDVEQDLPKLKEWHFSVDKELNARRLEYARDLVGDILPVVPKNDTTVWGTMATNRVVTLMGMENMLMSFYDAPEAMHSLMTYITESLISYLKWQEAEGLLTMNNGNHYAGAGSFGFTHALSASGENGRVLTSDIWLNTNSQESVGISPAMYEEFVYPYIERLASVCGKLYYGCCEPVHSFWGCLQRLPHLSKISISAWCNEELMGEALKGTGVIYSRKPSPNFIGAAQVFDEEAFRRHIARTVRAARDVNYEIIFRDIYTLMDDPTRAKRATRIAREEMGLV